MLAVEPISRPFPVGREFDIRSDYSHIRVYRGGSMRCLVFVRDNGVEAVQTCVDMSRPDELQAPYLRSFAQCYRYCQKHDDVLSVGLGGGALVHHYRRHYPRTRVDVVEIDPAIISVADKYFGVRGGGNVNIFNGDAYAYISKPGKLYDVIYVDAFLKPSSTTSGSGQPLFARHPVFLEKLKARLSVGGVAAFNCHDGYDDITSIRRAFPMSYVTKADGASVVIGVTRAW
jgi:spermidine synthase